jgi:hypothetical protein
MNRMARGTTSGSGVRSGFQAGEDGASLHEIRRLEAFGEELIDRAYDRGGVDSFPPLASELGGGSQLGHARPHLGGDLESLLATHRSAPWASDRARSRSPLTNGNSG